MFPYSHQKLIDDRKVCIFVSRDNNLTIWILRQVFVVVVVVVFLLNSRRKAKFEAQRGRLRTTDRKIDFVF